MSETPPATPCNIAAALPRLARERPEQVAMRCPGRNGRYEVALTYAQLDARSDAIAAGLAKRGIVRGTRTVVMVRPTPEFFLLMFALFDGRLLANGSFNWTRSATTNNDENLVVTDDANLVRVFGLQFGKLWQQFG